MRRRDGFALIGALIAAVLLAALIVGLFHATTEDVRISGSVAFRAVALNAAESAVQEAVGGWAGAQSDSLLIGQRAVHMAPGSGDPITTTMIRLDSTLFWIIGESGTSGGSSGSTMARRRIGVLVRRVADSLGRGSVFRLEERSWSELF